MYKDPQGSLMLQRTFFSFFFLLLLLGSFALINLFILRPEDEKEYQYLKNLKEMHQASSPKEITQLRTEVTKELFLPKETQRMQVKIQSNTSFLYLQKKGRKWHLKEKLESLTLYSQDKLYQNEAGEWFQKIQKLQAPQGWYNFSQQSFIAQKVALSFFPLPGKELPENIAVEKIPFSGSANEVFLSWKTKIPYFSATHLKANLMTKGS